MPASIALSALAWATPDGRAVLNGIALAFGPERTGLVGRNGSGKSTLLTLIAGTLRPAAGSVSVRGTLAVLDQSPGGDAHRTVADLFGAGALLDRLDRAAAGTLGAEELAGIDWTLEGRMLAALGGLGLEVPPRTPLGALSGGQRTRAALAAAVFAEPDFLLLDEPTNTLDRDGRRAVLSLLAGWRGGAIVVSHDRALLEAMDAIVELTDRGATRYGGNWSHYRDRKALEVEAARHDLADARKQVEEVARRAQTAAERKARTDGAGRRKADRGDLPRILLGTRRNRSEGAGGDAVRRSDRRRDEARAALETAQERVERLETLAVSVPPTGLHADRTVLAFDGVTAGYRPGTPVVRDLAFTIVGPERVAVAGPNGCGKSTVLALARGALAPWSGTVRRMVACATLDQEVGILDPDATIRENFLRLNPRATENDGRAALARFLFRADAAQQRVSTLSGGQRLRAGLACVLGGVAPPPLLILDEPTNHLDIASVEAIEAGLRAYDGALLVVSHDEAFLDAVGVSHLLDLERLDPGAWAG